MSKQPAPRRPKPGSRGHLPTGDLIALGPKTSRISDSDLKPLQPPKPNQPPPPKKSIIPGASERKREPSASISSGGGPKRTKVIGSPPYSTTKTGDSERRPSTSSTHISPIEVNPSDLERLVLEAEANGDRTRIDGLLLGAVRSLKHSKNKPDSVGCLGLFYLAKWKPECFVSTRVVEALTSLLKRDVHLNKNNKTLASLVAIMAANILLYVFQDIDDWPESFVKVYVEDSLGDRLWVDSDSCQSFVKSILTAFGTKTHPKTISRQSSDPGSKTTCLSEQPPAPVSTATSTTIFMPSTSKEEEEVVVVEEMDLSSNEEDVTSVIPRFTSPSVTHNISAFFLELIQDQLTRRQPVENISRNLLRLLMSTCGYVQIRLLVSQRIEIWLQNPKLTRPAQELLMLLCLNCNSHSHEDVEVISNLIRMRLKTKPLANHYITCVRELIGQHSDNLATVLKHVLYNELSTTRNPNNMSLLATMFQFKPEAASKILAMVFQDLLMNKDDYLRACRALLREIVRFLRYSLNFVALCRGFMQERTDSQFKELDGSLKERMLVSLTDLITMATMLSITPAVKECSVAFNRGLPVLQEFQKNVSTIQRDAVWWLHTVVPKMFNVTGQDFLTSLQKVLYLEPIDSYSGKDGWPQESDKSLFYSLASEVPVQEDTLMRVIIIGLSSELTLNAPEALDIADRIVKRAAAVKTGIPQLKVTRQELLDAMLNLCAYHHPKDIQLPSGYVPPKLAIANLYWKAWTLLTIVAALNPESIGQSGWENFPMLKSLMEMIMTNNCVFPPPTIASSNEEKEQIIAQDRQLVQIEKEEILQFESHLAAATTGVNITESNSLLLTQLITMDPVGPARRPPQSFMDELKAVNNSLKLGQKLCRSRSPDFLLDIIQRQGTSQSMPWLAELVQSSEGSLDVLPVQCLCEFLLMAQSSTNDEDLLEKNLNNEKHVLSRLRCLLMGPSADADATVEVLEYFMRRLSSGVTKERNAAAKGLELVLSQDSPFKESVVSFSDDVSMVAAIEEMSLPETTSSSAFNTELKWLLVNLPRLPHFETVRPICCYALRQCCQVEIVPQQLQAYLIFLSHYTGGPSEEDFTEALLEISQLVIARPTLFNQVLEGSSSAVETYQALLGMYCQAVDHAIEVQDNSYFESDMQDQLFAQWSKDTVHAGKAATLHALIIQASILLLTWAEPTDNPQSYHALLDSWCPDNGHVRVYLTDTGEEAMLLPEWLRLRMIRAESHRVVNAAVSDLNPSQLVLFAQSFGIPVHSMSKLLQRLDLAAQEDAMSVDQAVLDKGYMVQLVEVQQHRGAEGGDLFCSLLADGPVEKGSTFKGEEGHIKPLIIHSHQTPVIKDESMKSPKVPSKDNIDDIILKVLGLRVVEDGDQLDVKHLESVVKKHITNDLVKANKGEITEDSWSEVLISSLLKLLNTPDADSTVRKAFDQKRNFLCTVIRLLMSRQSALQRVSKASSSFPELIKTLSSRCSHGGPLACTVNQYKQQLGISTETSKKTTAVSILKEISQHEYDESLIRKFIMEAKHSKTETLDKETAIKACINVKSKNPELLEHFCKALFALIIYQNRECEPAGSPWNSKQSLPLKTCVEVLTALLSQDDSSASLSSGLFIDWLGSVDPEIVDVHPLLQRQILFSDRPHMSTEERSVTTDDRRSANSYLLASLAHNSKYSTLQDCLDWLLGQHEHSDRITPGAALDFLWTCHHIPRLWQGRDQISTAQATDHEDTVISLTPTQTCQVTTLVITEVDDAIQQLCRDKGIGCEDLFQQAVSISTDSTTAVRSQAYELIHKLVQYRIPLVLLCCHGNDSYVETIVRYVTNTTRWPKWLVSPFLVHLYLARPRISSCWKHFDTLFTSSVFTNATQCQLDELCHRALTVLADCRPGREYEDSANTSSLLCRKIASKHPILFLRHIPMISCLLRGRVHLTSKEFSNNQHLLLFSHVLGILDLLRPHVFKPDKFIEDGLQDILNVYLELVQSSCLAKKERAGVVSKFAEFLYQFCTCKPDQSQSILHANSALLSDLLCSFPDLPPLKCLVNALSVPNVHGTAVPLPTGSSSRFHSLIMPLDVTSWTPAQLAPVIQQLSPSQPLPDILKALNDLDETSKRRVDILQHFVAELVRLTSNSDSTVRTKAHTLIQRHVRQRPSDAYKFVGCFMDCLSCTLPDVTLTAAKFTPEFAVLCCEFSCLLLEKLFSVAVDERIDVVPSLARSIQLLNLDFTK